MRLPQRDERVKVVGGEQLVDLLGQRPLDFLSAVLHCGFNGGQRGEQGQRQGQQKGKGFHGFVGVVAMKIGRFGVTAQRLKRRRDPDSNGDW